MKDLTKEELEALLLYIEAILIIKSDTKKLKIMFYIAIAVLIILEWFK